MNISECHRAFNVCCMFNIGMNITNTSEQYLSLKPFVKLLFIYPARTKDGYTASCYKQQYDIIVRHLYTITNDKFNS